MGPLGIPELIFIFVLALLIFGPRKLPEIGRTIGRGLAEFRKASTDLKRTINAEMIEEEVRQSDPRKILEESLNPTPDPTSKPDEKPRDVSFGDGDDSSSRAESSEAESSEALISEAESSVEAPGESKNSLMRQAPGTVSRGSVSAADDDAEAVEVTDSGASGTEQTSAHVADAEQPVESKVP